MDITKIEGCTRVIGESQGYLGLPLRDITLNDTVTGPQTPAMESAWQPSDEELLQLACGAPLILRVVGNAHPPVTLYVGAKPEAN